MAGHIPTAGETPDAAPRTPGLAEAAGWWFRLGWISFGGPAGQIALMHQELVERRRWISERRFVHALNYCMLLPGPEAQQLATYIGWLLHGLRGGLIAGVLFVLPSLLIIAALSWAYLRSGPALSADLLYGIRPAVVALVLFAAWRLGARVLRQRLLQALALASFLAVWLGVSFPLVIAGAALVGVWQRQRITAPAAHSAGVARGASALIDDDTPTPAHARLAPRTLVLRLLAGVALGVLVYIGVVAATGGDGVLARMAAFFTQAALVTFGGAYAVMPYVFDRAVEHYGWLTAPQMLDGLALGETTPGPLIMVVAFIGFVGAAAAAAEPLTAGIAGACVATFFTFLPSFLFIFAGAPLVERTRDDFRLGGPLAAISAAVVGTIAHLGLVLAGQVFWPQGLAQSPDPWAFALAAAALVLLLRNVLGMIAVIALCGAAGLLLRFAV